MSKNETNEKTLALSRTACHKIRFECMSMRSQKLLFVPLNEIFWGCNENFDLNQTFDVDVSKEFLQKFLGVNYNSSHINSKISEWVLDMTLEMNGYDKSYRNALVFDNLYTIFRLKDITPDRVFFTITNPKAVTNLPNNKEGFIRFYQKDIINFKKKGTIPFIIYIYYHSESNSETDEYERTVKLSTPKLKKIFGKGVLDYVHFPKNITDEEILFYERYAHCCTSWFNFHTPNEIQRNKELLLIENNFDDSNLLTFPTIYAAEQKFEELKAASHYKRTEFDSKVVVPVLEEVNNSRMFNIHRQTVKHRPKKKGDSPYCSDDLFLKEYPKKGNAKDYGDVDLYVIKFRKLC